MEIEGYEDKDMAEIRKHIFANACQEGAQKFLQIQARNFNQFSGATCK
jgi:hypothetical protein